MGAVTAYCGILLHRQPTAAGWCRSGSGLRHHPATTADLCGVVATAGQHSQPQHWVERVNACDNCDRATALEVLCESTLMRVPRSSLLLLSSVMMAHHVLAAHHCLAAACAGCCCVRQVLGHITSPEREWHGSILCCYWLQYQLHRQLKQVGKQACAGRTC